MTDLSAAEARRIVLAAQGFTQPRPEGRVDIRHLRRVVRHVGVIQLDSVNVTVRAHHMPFFSRLGPYPMQLLNDLAYRRRELFEYWAHVASLVPTQDYAIYRHRMERAEPWERVRQVIEDEPGYIDAVYNEVAKRGPSTAADLADPGSRSGPWWGMAKGTSALEYLYTKGRLAVADRVNFNRVFDITERVLPPELLTGDVVPVEEAHRRMLMTAARSMGVATLADLADYFRIRIPEARPRLAELVDSRQLTEVTIEGWDQPAYMARGMQVPRRVGARALISPFDSLIWFRPRTERLFAFQYRIEIYVPQPQRQYGYYVYPFLMDDGFAGRVDLKADRKAGMLLAQGAWAEDGADPRRVAAGMAGELKAMASWLELDAVKVGRRGDLATALGRALG
jgi:hypothetical protein